MKKDGEHLQLRWLLSFE